MTDCREETDQFSMEGALKVMAMLGFTSSFSMIGDNILASGKESITRGRYPL